MQVESARNVTATLATARTLICGGPRTGKTTLAERMARESGCALRHTDSLISTHDWSSASAEVMHWFDVPGPWIVEGVAVGRALRKWLEAHPGNDRPADRLLWGGRCWVPLTPGQAAMAKGCETVLLEIMPELRRRGLRAETFY